MLVCINEAKNIAFLLLQNAMLEYVCQIKETVAKREDVLFRYISLRGNTSMGTRFDDELDLSQIFQSDSYLTVRLDEDVFKVCLVIVAVDADAGFTALLIKRVGLVVHSHLAEPESAIFDRDAGVSTYSAISKLVSRR